MTVSLAAARTFLFVPGNRPERFAKAAASGADAIICDLEDAVAPADKAHARQLVLEGLRMTPAVVRINAAGTDWHHDDLDAMARADGVQAVMLPKAEDPAVVRSVARRLRGIPLLLLIESARGIRDAAQLAEIVGVARLCFGNLDFALDAGITVRSDDEDELLQARSVLTIASRAAGLPGPVDGVVPEFGDADLMRRRAARALQLGFSGKLIIHPSQVEPVHAAFAPSDDELTWAHRVVEAAASADGAAVQVDGKMVDRPILMKAQEILARV